MSGSVSGSVLVGLGKATLGVGRIVFLHSWCRQLLFNKYIEALVKFLKLPQKYMQLESETNTYQAEVW